MTKNLHIDEFGLKENLSQRTYNVCSINRLFTVSHILDYHKKNKTFLNLKNIDKKTEYEIIGLCVKSLKKLQHEENLSQRTYNVCLINRLFTVSHILDYYKKNKTFLKLKNSGKKTEVELVGLCLKYLQFEWSELDDTVTHKSEIQIIFEKIKEHQYKWEYAKSQGDISFSRLSVRAKNSVRTLTEDVGFDLENFFMKAILIPCNFKEIRNTGKKAVSELISFRDDLQSILIDLENTEFNKVDLLIYELEKTLDLSLKNDEELIESIESRQLNLIQFFNNYVLQSNFCSELEKKLLINLLQQGQYKYLNNKSFLKDIAREEKLTYERIRQKLVGFDKNVSQKFNFLPKLFEYCHDLNFNIYECKFWKISSHPISNNQQGRIENTPNVLGNILSYFGEKKYYSLTKSLTLKAEFTPFDHNKYKRYRNFKVPCIINQNFLSEKLMIGILNTIYLNIHKKVTKDFIYEFDKFDLNNEQFNFVVYIVCQNFNLQQSEKKGVLIKRNTIITLPELIQPILKEKDDLMSAEEIFREFKRQFPERKSTLNSIRSLLTKDDNIIYLRGGGVSLYGLKEWEEKKGLKSGNIKEMCLEIIENSDEPVHLYTITKHVQKHRETSLKNIRTNLSLDPLKRFVAFDGSFIGLNNKKYPQSLIKSYNEVTPQRPNQICTFIKNHLYYDLKEVISKFSKDFNLKEVQIEHIINSKCNDGILKVKNSRVYYAMSEEDSFMSHVFKNSAKFTISGFNPYRIELKQKKVICRLIIINQTNFTANKQLLEFSSHDNHHTDFKSLFVYQKTSRSITCFIWTKEDDISIITDKQFYLSEEEEETFERINGSLCKLSFTEENNNNFLLSFENVINGNSNEKDLDLSMFNIVGMNKLTAISYIINLIELNTGVTINLVEAKKYYNLIQIENSIR